MVANETSSTKVGTLMIMHFNEWMDVICHDKMKKDKAKEKVRGIVYL